MSEDYIANNGYIGYERSEHLLDDKIIKKIKISKDKEHILFVFDDEKTLQAYAYAECCSSTWIEHIEHATEYPAKVLKVEVLEMPESHFYNDNELNDYIQYYGLCIKTDKGDIVIEYRNSSNGYYGGELAFEGNYCFVSAPDYLWETTSEIL